jgi:hypothetical protein
MDAAQKRQAVLGRQGRPCPETAPLRPRRTPTHTAVEQLSFTAIATTTGQFPALEFLQGLDERGKRDFTVAARVLATTLASGRPPSGRSERLAGSRCGLYELRITPRGRAGPHARLLFTRKQNTIRCATGILKRESLRRRDIELAERIVESSTT